MRRLDESMCMDMGGRLAKIVAHWRQSNPHFAPAYALCHMSCPGTWKCPAAAGGGGREPKPRGCSAHPGPRPCGSSARLGRKELLDAARDQYRDVHQHARQ